MFPCPHCGEMNPDDATACRHCGSDEKTGWRDDAWYHGVDIPGGYDYDYNPDDWREGGGEEEDRRRAAAVAVILPVVVGLCGLTLLYKDAPVAAAILLAFAGGAAYFLQNR